jgi:hypothetical protein
MTAQWLSVPRRVPSAYHEEICIFKGPSSIQFVWVAWQGREKMGPRSVSALLPTNGYQSGSDLLDTTLGGQKIELRSGITRVCNFKANA